MKLTDKPIDNVLDMAKASFNAGDYSDALICYEYFFDHALDDDPSLYYGVRLSCCLNGWQKLAEQYPPALERLEQKGYDSLAALEKTHSSRCFHDFMSICKYLKKHDEAIHRFLAYHESAPDLAMKIVHYIWDDLVQRQLWKVCEAYLNNFKDKYTAAFDKFVYIMELCNEEPSFKGEEVASQVQGWYVRDVSNLMLVLKNNDRHEEVSLVQQYVISDINSHGYPELISKINERVMSA